MSRRTQTRTPNIVIDKPLGILLLVRQPVSKAASSIHIVIAEQMKNLKISFYILQRFYVKHHAIINATAATKRRARYIHNADSSKP